MLYSIGNHNYMMTADNCLLNYIPGATWLACGVLCKALIGKNNFYRDSEIEIALTLETFEIYTRGESTYFSSYMQKHNE